MDDDLSMSQIGLKKHYEARQKERSPVERRVRDMLDKAMRHLAIIEPSIDDWNYPIGMKYEVKELCDEYFGKDVRPE